MARRDGQVTFLIMRLPIGLKGFIVQLTLLIHMSLSGVLHVIYITMKMFFLYAEFVRQADLLALLPLDILYAVPALRFNSLLRLPRVLKVRNSSLVISSNL